MAKVAGLTTEEERDRIMAAGYTVYTSIDPDLGESENMAWTTVRVDCDVMDLLVIEEANDENR